MSELGQSGEESGSRSVGSLSPEQEQALTDLARNPQNAEAIVGLAAAWSTEGIYREACRRGCAAWDAHYKLEAGSSETAISNSTSLLLSLSYSAMHDTLAQLQDKLASELDDFNKLWGWSEYTCVRFAAQTMLSSKALQNMPYGRLELETMHFEQSLDEPNPHTRLLSATTRELKRLQNLLQKTPGNARKETRLMATLAQETDKLFQAARHLQEGPVESAYVADNTPLAPVDWHILDRHHIIEKAFALGIQRDERSFGWRRAIAIFRGFSHFLANEPFSLEKTGDQTFRTAYVNLGRAGQGPFPMEALMLEFALCEDGHLYTEKELPLASITEKLGLSWQYELFRARAVSIYADIVLPSHLVDGSAEIRLAEREMTDRSRARSGDFVNLILARQKIFEQYPNLNTLAEKEQTNQTGRVNRYGIEGFIVSLPEGQQASRLQRDLCLQEQGILLPPEGQTYISEHTDGEGDSVDDSLVPHKARIRRVGTEIISQDTAFPDAPK